MNIQKLKQWFYKETQGTIKQHQLAGFGFTNQYVEWLQQQIIKLIKPTSFVVIAYRWGDRSLHSYTVGIFTDKDQAIKVADSHNEYRGGKYACVVEECMTNEFDNDLDEYSEEIYRIKSLRD